MMALGFAMVATATAGTVAHADGMAPGRQERTAATATRMPPSGPVAKSAGFYESVTQPHVTRPQR